MQRSDWLPYVDVPEGESRNRYTSAQNMSQENSYIYLQVDPPSMIGNNLGYFEQLPSRYICKRNFGFTPINIFFFSNGISKSSCIHLPNVVSHSWKSYLLSHSYNII